MIRWTGLAPWEFEFPFPGSLTSTSQSRVNHLSRVVHAESSSMAERCSSDKLFVLIISSSLLLSSLELSDTRLCSNFERSLIQLHFSAILGFYLLYVRVALATVVAR